jgi:fatty-acid desaturase
MSKDTLMWLVWLAAGVVIGGIIGLAFGGFAGYWLNNQVWLAHCSIVPNSFTHYICSQW